MLVQVLILVFELLVLCSSVSILFTEPAYAYVDPSVMTYTIQAVAGVAVALSAVAGVAMRRTRRKLFKLFRIDENAHKLVEPQVHRIDPGAMPHETGFAAVDDSFAKRAASYNNSPALEGDKFSISWPKRLVYALIVSVFTSMTYLLIAPFEIVAGSESSLILALSDVAPISISMTIAAALVCALLVSLIPGKWFMYAISAVFSIGLGGWAQSMFLNVGLPSADGTSIAWNEYDRIAILSAIVWCAIFVSFFVLANKRSSIAKNVVAGLSLALIIVQGVGVASIVVSTSEFSPDGLGSYSSKPTEDGLFEVSDKKNVIVFVLDTYDTKDLIRLGEENKSVLDEGFEGFTWFKNTTGSLMPTRYAVPFLLTGELPRDDDKWSHYLEERYMRSDFISDISNEGYSIGLYSDSLRLDNMSDKDIRERVAEKTVNLHRANSDNTNVKGVAVALLQSSLYRDLPWVLKPRFWFTTDWMNSKMVLKEASAKPENTLYVMDDAEYYKKLKKRGLSVESRDAVGAFRFIHLLGTHRPYNLDANGKKTGDDKSTLDDQAIGTMKIVKRYLTYLREMGLYDDACIIITADHGILQLFSELDRSAQPILLVKPPQSHEEAAKPLEVTDAEATHADIIPTIIKEIGGDETKYAGEPVFDIDPDKHSKRKYLTTRESDDYKHDDWIIEWEIDGDTVDFANWKMTGKSWNARE